MFTYKKFDGIIYNGVVLQRNAIKEYSVNLEFMFDKITVKNGIEYGIVNGNDKLFFVKVGNGGGIYGYENKYLKISGLIHEKYGCSVLVSSNPLEISVKESVAFDFDFIEENFPSASEVAAFGNSQGGKMLVAYAYMCPKIKSVLAVNAPLMINLHKTKAGIKNFEGDMIHMIYGEKDPSYPYVEILRSSISPKFSYSTVKNADHKFTNMLEEFISLPERFLFDIQSGKRKE